MRSKLRGCGKLTQKKRVPRIAEAVCDLAQWEWHNGKATLPGALHRHAWNPVIFPQSDNVYESLAIFGTPFGPDVLVATDKLSEGIDLHRYCRIMVHYELDSSPVRVQATRGPRWQLGGARQRTRAICLSRIRYYPRRGIGSHYPRTPGSLRRTPRWSADRYSRGHRTADHTPIGIAERHACPVGKGNPYLPECIRTY